MTRTLTLTVGTRTPSGTGTTDRATKPVFTVSKETPPTETTRIGIVCGTGAEAVAGSPVEVKYVGDNYADGAEFDSSWKHGATRHPAVHGRRRCHQRLQRRHPGHENRWPSGGRHR